MSKVRMALVSCFFVLLAAQAYGQGKDEIKLPLEPNNTLEFNVQTATWLALDVDPSGYQFVIEVLGDLYLLPIGGGVASPLLVGPAFDSQPRFSPDGRSIAFISDRDGRDNLWIMELETEKLTKLTKGDDQTEYASPAWSQDGEHVVVSRSSWAQRTYELWAYHLEGGKGVALTKAKPQSDTPRSLRHNALGAVYGPGGRYLYYARKNGGFAYNLQFPQWQIVRRDLQTNNEDFLTFAQGSAIRPVISPDGEWLVYGTRFEQQTGLRRRHLPSGRDEWLAYPITRDEQESRFTRDLLPNYGFAPDGQTLYTTRDGGLIGIDMQSLAVTEIEFQVDVKQDVVERLSFPYRLGLGPVKARLLEKPSLSPNRDRVAFAALQRIYVHDLVSGKTQAISPADKVASAPSWSPRGNELVYVDFAEGGGHIWRQRARANARPRRLTEQPGFYNDPAWSPDGKRIVALRASSHERLAREYDFAQVVGSDVIWLPAGGGESQVVVPARGLARPHFGPEDDRIYFHAAPGYLASGGSGGLLSLRFDGTDRRRLLKVKGPGIFYAEDDVPSEFMEVSPDGKHVLVQHANQLYVVKPLPFLRNQTLNLNDPNLPMVQLTDVGSDYAAWSPDGDTIMWSVGSHLYRRPLSSLQFQEVTSKQKSKNGDKDADKLLEQDESVDATEIDVYLPRPSPEGVIALIHGTALTMEDAVIEDAAIVIEGERIKAVGAYADVDIPADAEVIDLDGQFVLPGFVDTHAHFRAYQEVAAPSNWSFLANLAYGVTTGIDVQPSTVDLLGAQDQVAAGLMLGPRVLSTGPGIFDNNRFKSAAQAHAVLTRYRDHYGVRNLKFYISGSRQQRQWLVEAARDLKLNPTAEGGLDMRLDLTHMLDGFSGNEHNFPLPRIYDDVVQLAALTNIAYTPTLLVNYGGPSAENYFYSHENPHDDAKLRRFTPYYILANRTLRRTWAHEKEYIASTVAASALNIVRAGGQVGVGSHGQLQGLGYHWELWALASGGFEPMEALRSATLMGAQMIGVDQDVGSLKVGKLADLVVLTADPRQDIRHTNQLRYVMKGGMLYEADTLNQVWPEAKPLPPQWWWQLYPSSTLGAQQ